ncbi:outer membrane beta-barrel protein [Lysobacter brunescens]|uniref:Outer membrane beta-barrel protein n=1 Tax=Lysobacter brunescens TaxID=262323 RepID=A0ABW2YCK4_9GAMM
MKKIALFAALAAVSLTSNAFAADGKGAFLRAEAGNTRIHYSAIDDSENDVGYNLRGGYFINQNLAFEAFVGNLGGDGIDGASIDAINYGVGIVGKKSFGETAHEGFFIGGRVGVARIDVDLDVDGAGNFEGHSNHPYIGASIGYDFNANMGLSLNVDHQKFSSNGLDGNVGPVPVRITDVGAQFTTVTLGFEYRF